MNFKPSLSFLAGTVLVLPLPAMAADLKWEGEVFSNLSLGLVSSNLSAAPAGAPQGTFTSSLPRLRLGAKSQLASAVSVLGRLEVPGGLWLFPNATGISPKPPTTPLLIQDIWATFPLSIQQAWVNWDSPIGSFKAGLQDSLWAVPVEERWSPMRYIQQDFSTAFGFEPSENALGITWSNALGPLQLALSLQNTEFASAPASTASLPAAEASVLYNISDSFSAGLMARYAHVSNSSSYYNVVATTNRFRPIPVVPADKASLLTQDATKSLHAGQAFTSDGGDEIAFMAGAGGKMGPAMGAFEVGLKTISASTSLDPKPLGAMGFGASLSGALPNIIGNLTPFARIDYGNDNIAASGSLYSTAITTVGIATTVSPNVKVALAVKDYRNLSAVGASIDVLEANTAITF